MFDMNEILAALQNGTSAEDIANEMTKALNDAIAEKEIADKKAHAAAEEAKRNKEKALCAMFDAVNDFAVACGLDPLFSDDEINAFATNEDVIKEFTELMESVAPLMSAVKSLSDLCDDDCDCKTCKSVNDKVVLNNKSHIYNEPKVKMNCGKPGSAVGTMKLSDTDIVNEFLKMFG